MSKIVENMSTIRVLIVDDHKVVRKGLRVIFDLQDELKVSITEAENSRTAINKAKTDKFDIIFMDIDLGNDSGIDLTRDILSITTKARVIMLSMHEEPYVVQRSLDAGALGYLLKNAGPEEIVKAVNTVLEGRNYYSNEVAISLLDKKRGAAANTVLSQRELQILKLIVDEYTNEQIAQMLELSKRTIDGHRQNMINKLGVRNSIGLVRYAYEHTLFK